MAPLTFLSLLAIIASGLSETFLKLTAEKFGIKDLGEPKYVLGVDVTHTCGVALREHNQHRCHSQLVHTDSEDE